MMSLICWLICWSLSNFSQTPTLPSPVSSSQWNTSSSSSPLLWPPLHCNLPWTQGSKLTLFLCDHDPLHNVHPLAVCVGVNVQEGARRQCNTLYRHSATEGQGVNVYTDIHRPCSFNIDCINTRGGLTWSHVK